MLYKEVMSWASFAFVYNLSLYELMLNLAGMVGTGLVFIMIVIAFIIIPSLLPPKPDHVSVHVGLIPCDITYTVMSPL